MSALTRMAHDRHKGIRIRKDDRIILSSRFIPGNEKAIAAIINNLYRLGAEVVYEKVSDIHSSGHAYREELKLMLAEIYAAHFSENALREIVSFFNTSSGKAWLEKQPILETEAEQIGLEWAQLLTQKTLNKFEAATGEKF